MVSEEQKKRAREILAFLESKIVKDEANYKIIDIECVDRNMFDVIYRLDGVVNGMYDEVED